MKIKKDNSRSRINFYVDIIILLPFLLLIISGLFMLVYHSGKPYTENILGRGGYFWLAVHQALAMISLVLISIHLYLHLDWIKKLFSGKLRKKYRVRNLTLFILFLLTTLTSLIPWMTSGESNAAEFVLGIHNKIGLLMIIFIIIHLLTYFRWLIGMTKKVLKL